MSIDTLNDDEKERLASDDYTTCEQLIALSFDVNPDVRRLTAIHKDIPTDVLWRLANDPNEDVRAAVASNSRTPPACLDDLSNNHSKYVRAMVANNEKCPIDILLSLSEDQNPGVRDMAVQHENLPFLRLIEIALHDPIPQVRISAQACANDSGVTDESIRNAISTGLSLSARVGNGHQGEVLGNRLLSEGMLALYQRIQSLELQAKLPHPTQHLSTTKRFRM
ncbi:MULTISPECIES: HEAT repeat domain-containing protein [Aeromonas]|uniref:HEAT repeat domain-containing protein n=1 Tax=Aeromonas veronii TaxID=654 RepID=A0A4S5CHB8_AERVE|nr:MULTISPECIES: HEAT repeat domain-containing protein [Aeromonas]THJ43615.1 HEAT repeat domain-containing protein [Aeromonas veronii]